ncbi:MAG: hypothetical protein MJ245_03645 [Clostridia bacterium]|nr:hypothetical protein [Clostridia bacterium]
MKKFLTIFLIVIISLVLLFLLGKFLFKTFVTDMIVEDNQGIKNHSEENIEN